GGQLAASVILLARAIPLLMLFSVVLFLTTEMWQTFARMDDASLGAIAGLLVAVGTLFLVARLPREVAALEREVGGGPPLDRRQRFNVGLVMFVSHALQVLVVSPAVGVFFVAFRLVATPAALLDACVGGGPWGALRGGAGGLGPGCRPCEARAPARGGTVLALSPPAADSPAPRAPRAGGGTRTRLDADACAERDLALARGDRCGRG